MITITRRLEFDYGHRVLGHGGKCRSLHGHRGVAEITVQATQLDGLGMVVDFSLVKELIGGWIDAHWDHTLLLHPSDPQLAHLQETEERPPYTMIEGNPTAENMAAHLWGVSSRLLSSRGFTVVNIRIFETPNCWADYPSERV